MTAVGGEPTVEVDDRVGVSEHVDIDATVRTVLRAEDVPPGAEVAVLVVDAAEMADLNARYRGKDGPTDVLSFPMDDPATAVAGVPWHLGDVVLCPAAAEDPLPTLLIHGVLHLLGYDHETDAGQMLARQAELVRWSAEDAVRDPED